MNTNKKKKIVKSSKRLGRGTGSGRGGKAGPGLTEMLPAGLIEGSTLGPIVATVGVLLLVVTLVAGLRPGSSRAIKLRLQVGNPARTDDFTQGRKTCLLVNVLNKVPDLILL